ncbi:MAG TPA: protein BatD, partial [Lysobacter sp.]|nr:protein BatD [Lysobacter sp.]
QIRYQSTPQELRAGSAATLTVEVTADGATAAQMPELQLPPIDGVQVFAEPVQADERFVDGRPRVKLTRAFSLVPARAGDVRLSGLRLGWWDVGAGAARTASLPPLTWPVAAADGAGGVASPATPAPAAAASGAVAPAWALSGSHQAWVLAALLFAALWLFTLVWAVQQRGQAHAQTGPATVPGVAVASRPDTASLKRALDTGGFAEVGDALCALARPVAHDLDEVRARLDDPAQRDALDAMQRARWGDGDGVAARAQLRTAFARGPRWRSVPAAKPAPLPPLYPSG